MTVKRRLLLFCFSVLFHMYDALKQTQNKLFWFCFGFVLDLFWNCFALFCFSCKSRFSCEDIARRSYAMVPRRRIFGDFFASCMSASRVQYVSDLHPKFAPRPHHVQVWQTCNLRRLRLGEEKGRRYKKKPQGKNIMGGLNT